MKAYSAERKEALVRRMTPPERTLVSAMPVSRASRNRRCTGGADRRRNEDWSRPTMERILKHGLRRTSCRRAGERPAQCGGAGRVLSSKTSLSGTDIGLASGLPFGQCECFGATLLQKSTVQAGVRPRSYIHEIRTDSARASVTMWLTMPTRMATSVAFEQLQRAERQSPVSVSYRYIVFSINERRW